MNTKNNAKINLNTITGSWNSSFSYAQNVYGKTPSQEAINNTLRGAFVFLTAYAFLFVLHVLFYLKSYTISGKSLFTISGLLISGMNFVLFNCILWFLLPFLAYVLIRSISKKNLSYIFCCFLYLVILFFFFPSLNFNLKEALGGALIKSMRLTSQSWFDIIQIEPTYSSVVGTVSLFNGTGLIKNFSIEIMKPVLLWLCNIFIWLSQLLVFSRMALPYYFSIVISGIFSFILTLITNAAIAPLRIIPLSDPFTSLFYSIIVAIIFIYIFVILDNIALFLKGIGDLVAIELKKRMVKANSKDMPLIKAETAETKVETEAETKVETEASNEDAYPRSSAELNKERNILTIKKIILPVLLILALISIFYMMHTPNMPVYLTQRDAIGDGIVVIVHNKSEKRLPITAIIKMASQQEAVQYNFTLPQNGDKEIGWVQLLGKDLMSKDTIILRLNGYKDYVYECR